ncbi:hypothetical protein [Lignipirellula cremea]|uniref:Uncharacterized protein n=1 Tax=Lignipirellula cremea TaxID=2528010 RepID=A0A518DSQ3_9BACT|nr:hypothetical protein [Lignipirellula cremea]QDU94828.1 hypothetical protein Pla8534_26360 [Lignipirellula cremea]
MSCLLGYLDPGVGSILLQVAAAAVLSFTVMFRQYVCSPFAYLWGKKQDRTED